MSQNGEEEEAGTETASSGRPNSYWAEVRARQELEAARADGYGGNYRGVPAPRSGPQSVHPKDTTGSYEECWCGQPEGHDWPGKDKGRRHPRKESKVTAVAADEAPHIDRRVLRAYHEDLIDIITRCVNDYGLRYRLRSNSILLYPKDGSTPVTVHARNSQRAVPSLKKWFVTHVADEETEHALEKVKSKPMDPADAARLLAEKLNSEEHPVETPANRRRREEMEARQRAERERVEQEAVAASVERPRPVPAPPAQALAVSYEIPEQREEEFHLSETDIPEGWEVFHTKKGKVNDHFITDGEVIRCVDCDFEVPVTDGHRIGAHWGTIHDPNQRERMYGPKGQAKKVESLRATRQRQGVERGLKVIAEAMGIELGDDSAKLAKVTAERDEYKAKYEEAKARIDLLKEALRA